MNHTIIAQINPTVGDIQGNLALIMSAVENYAQDSTALLVFPELAITGYPPEDLLTRPEFITQTVQVVEQLVQRSAGFQCSILVGSVWLEHDLVYNAALLIEGGEIRHIHKKNSLPNYGVFDERRYFAQGSAPIAINHQGQRLGILICEDAWFEHNWQLLKRQGASSVLAINASPFEVGKQQQRLDYFSNIAATNGLALTYVNMAGAQDDLVFDGASFAMDSEGKLTQQCAAFSPVTTSEAVVDYPPDLESVWLAIGSGLKNYVEKNHIPRIVLGLSGGIDSAVVAALAVDVLGAGQVHGMLLPSEFTSDASNDDAQALATHLGIETSIVPISPFMAAAEEALIPALGAGTDWREDLAIGGNLQARLRGNILMAHSNALGGVVLNTSNKSELAVGYSTMYGDACGAYSPLKDIYKTMVYQLASWRNKQSAVIPDNIIHKPPTAELKPAQQDSDQLPDYPVLDAILHGLIEEKLSIQQIAARGMDEALVMKIYHMLRQAEYKRRQFPPGPKISSMLFGKDWRYPLTSGYDNHSSS